MPQTQQDTANVVIDLQWGTIAQGEHPADPNIPGDKPKPFGLEPAAQKEYLDRVATHIEESRARGVPVIWVSVNDRVEFHNPVSDSSEVRDEGLLRKMGFLDGAQPVPEGQRAAFENYKKWLNEHGPHENEAIYEKKSFSTFADGPDLLNHIKDNGWKNINLIGGNDDVCVLSTAIGAAENDIHATILPDLVKGDDNPRLDKGNQHHVDKLSRDADNLIFNPDQYEGHLKNETFAQGMQINDANKAAIREKISFQTSEQSFSSIPVPQHDVQQSISGVRQTGQPLTANDWTYENPYDLHPATKAFTDAIERELTSMGSNETLVILSGEEHTLPVDKMMNVAIINHLAAKRDEAPDRRAFLYADEQRHDFLQHYAAEQFDVSLPKTMEDPNGHLAATTLLASNPINEAPYSINRIYQTALAHDVPIVFSDSGAITDIRHGGDPDLAEKDPLLSSVAKHLGIDIGDKTIHKTSPKGMALRNGVMVQHTLQEAQKRGIHIILHSAGQRHLFGDVTERAYSRNSDAESHSYVDSLAHQYSQTPGVRVLTRLNLSPTPTKNQIIIDPQAWDNHPNTFIERGLDNEGYYGLLRGFSNKQLINPAEIDYVGKLEKEFSGPKDLLGKESPLPKKEDVLAQLQEIASSSKQQQLQQQQQARPLPTDAERDQQARWQAEQGQRQKLAGGNPENGIAQQQQQQQARPSPKRQNEPLTPGVNRTENPLTANDWTYRNPYDLHPPTDVFTAAIERELASMKPDETLVILAGEAHYSPLDIMRRIPEITHLAVKRDEAPGSRPFLYSWEQGPNLLENTAALNYNVNFLEAPNDPNGHLTVNAVLAKHFAQAAIKSNERLWQTVLDLDVPAAFTDAAKSPHSHIERNDPLLPNAVKRLANRDLNIDISENSENISMEGNRHVVISNSSNNMALRNAITVERTLQEAQNKGVRIVYQAVGSAHIFGNETEGLQYAHSLAGLYKQMPGVRVLARFDQSPDEASILPNWVEREMAIDPQAWIDHPNTIVERGLNRDAYINSEGRPIAEELAYIGKLENEFSGPKNSFGQEGLLPKKEDVLGGLLEIRHSQSQQQQITDPELSAKSDAFNALFGRGSDGKKLHDNNTAPEEPNKLSLAAWEQSTKNLSPETRRQIAATAGRISDAGSDAEKFTASVLTKEIQAIPDLGDQLYAYNKAVIVTGIGGSLDKLITANLVANIEAMPEISDRIAVYSRFIHNGTSHTELSKESFAGIFKNVEQLPKARDRFAVYSDVVSYGATQEIKLQALEGKFKYAESIPKKDRFTTYNDIAARAPPNSELRQQAARGMAQYVETLPEHERFDAYSSIDKYTPPGGETQQKTYEVTKQKQQQLQQQQQARPLPTDAERDQQARWQAEQGQRQKLAGGNPKNGIAQQQQQQQAGKVNKKFVPTHVMKKAVAEYGNESLNQQVNDIEGLLYGTEFWKNGGKGEALRSEVVGAMYRAAARGHEDSAPLPEQYAKGVGQDFRKINKLLADTDSPESKETADKLKSFQKTLIGQYTEDHPPQGYIKEAKNTPEPKEEVNAEGPEFHGEISPGFRRSMQAAHNTIHPAVRSYLPEQGTKFLVGQIQDDINPDLADKYHDPTMEESRLHQNESSGAFRADRNQVITTEYYFDSKQTSSGRLQMEPGQRPFSDGRLNPGWAKRSMESSAEAYRHETYHGLNHHLGYPSESPGFKAAHQRDVERLGGAKVASNNGLGYFINESEPERGWSETFAQSGAEIDGGGRIGFGIARNFPDSFEWTKGLQQKFAQAYASGPGAIENLKYEIHNPIPEFSLEASNLAVSRAREALRVSGDLASLNKFDALVQKTQSVPDTIRPALQGSLADYTNLVTRGEPSEEIKKQVENISHHPSIAETPLHRDISDFTYDVSRLENRAQVARAAYEEEKPIADEVMARTATNVGKLGNEALNRQLVEIDGLLSGGEFWRNGDEGQLLRRKIANIISFKLPQDVSSSPEDYAQDVNNRFGEARKLLAKSGFAEAPTIAEKLETFQKTLIAHHTELVNDPRLKASLVDDTSPQLPQPQQQQQARPLPTDAERAQQAQWQSEQGQRQNISETLHEQGIGSPRDQFGGGAPLHRVQVAGNEDVHAWNVKQPHAPPRASVLKATVQSPPVTIETHAAVSAPMTAPPAPVKATPPTTTPPASASGQQGSQSAPAESHLAPATQEISTPPAKLSLNGSASEWNPRMQGMNSKIGTAAIVINLADAALKKDPRKAAEVGGTALAMHAGMKVAGKVVGAEMVPVVGEVVGGIFAGKDAYDAAKSGHAGRATVSGIEATLYTVSAAAGAATLVDCWNPTVIAPAAVALVAGGAAVTITAAKGVYDNWNTIKGWFSSEPSKPDAAKPTALVLPDKPARQNLGALKTETPVITSVPKQAAAQQAVPARNVATKNNKTMVASI